MVAPALVAAAVGIARHFGPDLVRLVAGDKAGKVAEKVVAIAQEATGAETPAQAEAALVEDAALADRFKLAVLGHVELLEEMAARDRADARSRDLDLRRLGTRNLRADLMVVLDVVGALSCLAAIVYVTLQGAKGSVDGATVGAVTGSVGTLAGLFLSGLRDAHQFEFGSSRGSVEKSAILAERAGAP